MLYTRNPFTRDLATEDFTQIVLQGAQTAQKNYIRNRFDNSSADYEALACIQVAKNLGLTELASEMENDLIELITV